MAVKPEQFERMLGLSWPVERWCDVGVVVAVSGGPDSVALLRAMAALKPDGGGPLAVAHFNHRLRGEESNADERFVVDLCRRLNLPCEIGRPVTPLAETATDGLENAARNARYAFFLNTAERLGVRYLATAHTADDQAETILHRILRGTGIAGLAGMSRVRALSPAVTLIRPLLGVSRRQVLDYLTALGQPACTDSSNADPQHTRNRIRNDLFPRLAAEYNPDVTQAILRLGTLAGEVQAAVAPLVDGLAERAVLEQTPTALRINPQTLAGQPAYLVRETLISLWRRQQWPLQAMGHDQWQRLAELLAAVLDVPCGTSGKHVFPGQILAEPSPGQLRLSRSRE